MKGFHWRADRRALVSAKVHEATIQAVGDAAEYVLETANRTVPLEEGTLQRSGDVDHDGLKATISYDTPYACRQHEDSRNRHDSGRRAKWLEKTFQEETGKVREFLKSAIGKAMK
jgi:hypothetical protein